MPFGVCRLKIPHELVQHGLSRRMLPQRRVPKPKPTPQGFALHPELGGDTGDAYAESVQSGRPKVRCSRREQIRSHAIDRTTRCCAKPIGESLDGISEIAEQMPPISSLNRARRTLPNALVINAGSIAGDNFDTWVNAEPSRVGCSIAVRQELARRTRENPQFGDKAIVAPIITAAS